MKRLSLLLTLALFGCGSGSGTSTPPPSINDLGNWSGTWTLTDPTTNPDTRLDSGSADVAVSLASDGKNRAYTLVLTSGKNGSVTRIFLPSPALDWWTVQRPGQAPYTYQTSKYNTWSASIATSPPVLNVRVIVDGTSHDYRIEATKLP